MASGSSPLRYGSTPLRSPLRYGRGLLAKLPSAKALSWGVGVVSREGAAASKSSARVVSSHLASVRVRAWRLSSDPEAAVRIRPRRRMSWLHLYICLGVLLHFLVQDLSVVFIAPRSPA
jgi:hypothetical protein